MSWFARIWNSFRSDRLDRELEEEMQHHLAMRAAEAERRGDDSDTARRAAEQRFGNTLSMKERTRDMDVSEWIDTAVKDLKYAGRQMLRSPGFTIVAVASLALGIGANTAIFTLMNSVLMKTLPVRDPEQLVMLSNPDAAGVGVGSSTGERGLLTWAEYEQLRDRLDTFDGMFASESSQSRYDARINGGAKEDVRGRLVSGSYFNVLGVTPFVGRLFTDRDDRNPGQDPYAVLSYSYWQSRFSGAPSAIGSTIQVGKATLTVIGVAGPGFWGETVGQRPDVFIPMMMEPQVKPGTDWLHEDLSKNPDKVMWLHVFGRLKPGVSLAQAQAKTNVIFKNILANGYGSNYSAEARKEFLNQQLILHPASKGASVFRSEAAQPLTILLVVVGLVLLIACANIANLLLARAAARTREIGVRIALGASRIRLIRQLLTESFLLAVLGTITGVALAKAAALLLVKLIVFTGQFISTDFDLRVMAFTVGLGLLTTIVFGALPAIRATRLDTYAAVKEGARTVGAASGKVSFTKLIVVFQVALSLLLLVGAGLFLRTLQNLKHVELGYPRENLVVLRLNGEAAGYGPERRAQAYDEITQRLQQMPGVAAVAYSENGLFGGTESGDTILVEGFTPKREQDQSARFDIVSARYFQTLHVPLLLGREFDAGDVASKRRVTVINEAFAKRFFAGRNPIGRHVTDVFGDTKLTFEVIGVAADVRDHQLRGDVPPRFYIPPRGGSYIPTAMNFEIRASAAGAPGVLEAARKAISGFDDNLPIMSARRLDDLIGDTMTIERVIATLASIFGAIAVALACIGLYGVISYGVARRTSEIGVRMAMGAQPSSVMRMILSETSAIVVIGTVVGVCAAVGATRLVASALYGVSPLDPVTIVSAVVALGVVALLAGLLPAQRASRVNPLVALRNE